MSVRAYKVLEQRDTKTYTKTTVAEKPTFTLSYRAEVVRLLSKGSRWGVQAILQDGPDYLELSEAELQRAVARATGVRTKAVLRALLADAQAAGGSVLYFCF